MAVIVLLLGGRVGRAQPPSSPNPGGHGGPVYQQNILVSHKNGDFEWVPVYIVRERDNRIVIIDKNGQDYRTLEDFQRNNKLFTEDDKLTLPNDFPAIHEPGENIELMTVPSHISPSQAWLYWGIGGGGLALVGIVTLISLAARRWINRGASGGFDDEVSTLEPDEHA